MENFFVCLFVIRYILFFHNYSHLIYFKKLINIINLEIDDLPIFIIFQSFFEFKCEFESCFLYSFIFQFMD
jgi:hypothetical protein